MSNVSEAKGDQPTGKSFVFVALVVKLLQDYRFLKIQVATRGNGYEEREIISTRNNVIPIIKERVSMG
jgi:hypothetical protein